MKKILNHILPLVVFGTATVANAQSVELIVDNDYAIFAGTLTSIDRLIYNNSNTSGIFDGQLIAASSLDLTIQPGETYLQLLALGAGDVESVSGRIGGFNLVNVFNANNADIQLSNNILASLPNHNFGTIQNQSYSASLSDGQAAFAGVTTWSNPTITDSGAVRLNPAAEITPGDPGEGFEFPITESVFFRIATAAVPEPSSVMLLGTGMMGLLLRRRNSRAA